MSSGQKKNTKLNESKVKVFMGGLPTSCCNKEIEHLLSKLSDTKDIQVSLKLRSNKRKCLGSGIAKMDRATALTLTKIGSFFYKQRKVRMMMHREGAELKQFREQLTKRRLFIKNFPKDINVKKLQEYFEKYGKLESVYLRGEPGSELKVAVVIFEKKSSARLLYQDYRFGKICFKAILGKQFRRRVAMGFRFIDLKIGHGNCGQLRNEIDLVRPVTRSGDPCQQLNSEEQRIEMILSCSRPGKKAYDYNIDNDEEYWIRRVC